MFQYGGRLLFIGPRMSGEIGLFHDKPTSLLLVLLIPRSSPPIHLHPERVFELGVKGCSCLTLDLTLYSTLLYFTFCILPFIGYLLVILLCNDILVLSSTFDLLL
jgi:hypothetical protein